MTDRNALFRAVLERPAEDTPRLALADYLDEFGSARDRARAELIRAQVRLGGWPCECDSEEERVYHDECRCHEKTVLGRRVPEILRKWGTGWLPRSGRQAAAVHRSVAMSSIEAGVLNPGHYVFRRGFVDQVELVITDRTNVARPAVRLAVGNFFREVLAGHPVSRIVFALRDHAPDVVFEFAADHDLWACAAADDSRDLIDALARRGRRTLLAELPEFVAGVLAGIEFERVRDHDDWPDEPIGGGPSDGGFLF